MSSQTIGQMERDRCVPQKRNKAKGKQKSNTKPQHGQYLGGGREKKKSLSTIENTCGHTLGQREAMENKNLTVARMGGSRINDQ